MTLGRLPTDRWPDTLLRWFAMIWMGLAAIVLLVSAGMMFAELPFWTAFWTVTDWFSPWNVASWLANLLLIAPAIAVVLLLDWRRKRHH